MYIAIQTFNEHYKKKVKKVLEKEIGDVLSIMGFFYYRHPNSLPENIILFLGKLK